MLLNSPQVVGAPRAVGGESLLSFPFRIEMRSLEVSDLTAVIRPLYGTQGQIVALNNMKTDGL